MPELVLWDIVDPPGCLDKAAYAHRQTPTFATCSSQRNNQARTSSSYSQGDECELSLLAHDELTMARDEITNDATLIMNDPSKPSDEAAGVANVEATQRIWGKKGRYVVIAGIGLSMVVYQLDNSTTFNYRSYALSSYTSISLSTTLLTAATILFAVCKPLYAKLADVIGRGETYVIAVVFFLLSYILCAASQNVATYAVGTLFHSIAATGMNIMNDIVVSDITTPRWRTFGLSCAFLPFLIVPWCGGFIVDSVVAEGGIGWRWGFGILAIVLPLASSLIIITLIYYQSRAKRAGITQRTPLTIRRFLSQTDALGLFLLMAGFAMFLLPINLAATTTSRWGTPWIPAVLVVGVVVIVVCVLYEIYVAKHPVLPGRYFTDATIICCFLIGMCDQIGFEGTHAYLYNWSVLAKGYSALQATYLGYVNGVTQTFVSILVGLWIAQKRYHFKKRILGRFPFISIRLAKGDSRPSYRTVLLVGSCIRLIGYGVMLRLRGTSNSDAELYIVQLIQGIGTGFISILIIVAAQLRVPHAEMAQITSLVLLFQFVGAALGSTYAGAIYTNNFRESLRSRLGDGVDESVVTAVFESITSEEIPAKGTEDRNAIDYAYSDVMRLITYVALAFSIVLFMLCTLLCLTKQNKVNLSEDRLPGAHSNVDEDDEAETKSPHVSGSEEH